MKPIGTSKLRIHLLFWILYYILEVYLDFYWSRYQFPDFSWQLRLQNTLMLELGYLLIKVPLAYSLLYVYENPAIKRFSKYFLGLLIIVLAVLVHRFFTHFIMYPYIYGVTETLDGKELSGYINGLVAFNSFMDLIFMVGLVFGVEITRQKNVLKEQISQLKSEKLDQELTMLKAQINPHFLFNTLNNIYGMALKKADETPEVILQLSKVMRYNIYEAAEKSISVRKDLENIRDFIQIQKIRYRHLSMNFTEDLDNPSQEISPLILIQFVENAFKHGVSESLGEAFITIKIVLKNGILTYFIENSKEEMLHKHSTKIGLKNIRRQLELLYPKHSLIVEDKSDRYIVQLIIDFNDTFRA
ncbi:histidine kinase [Chryseobacterium lactis]|uniref:Histidine kinase n=1 Tax=Chryseobacterium lactis TaxID=1241981 RepID=A0A3G6RLG2_CHRLC|nr:histidine kinase [Chryseobacterium lactis]AZA83664.1 histidine kinase [Chryseobacterium lactis]AZB04049.1 histidine kinase [Chryseobacterium lactis]PNW13042.1 histidine kinase [Chryseobacterium lactis]